MKLKNLVLFASAAIALSSCAISRNVNNTASASYQKLMLVQQDAPKNLETIANNLPAEHEINISPSKNPPSSSVSATHKPASIAGKIIKSMLKPGPVTQAGIDKIKSISIRKGHIRIKNAYDYRNTTVWKALEIFLFGIALGIAGMAIDNAINVNYSTSPSTGGATLLPTANYGWWGFGVIYVLGQLITYLGYYLFLKGAGKLIQLIVTNKNGDMRNIPVKNSIIVLLLAVALCIGGLVLIASNDIYYGSGIYGLMVLGELLFILSLYAFFIGITSLVRHYKERNQEKALPDF